MSLLNNKTMSFRCIITTHHALMSHMSCVMDEMLIPECRRVSDAILKVQESVHAAVSHTVSDSLVHYYTFNPNT